MVSVVALLLILCAVYFVVLVGTVAYQLTGLDWDTAQFQALSAFTGTGFTTRVAELVMHHRVRRRITLALILVGYASTATILATLVSSVALQTPIEVAVNLTVLVVALSLVLFLARKRGIQLLIAAPIRRWMTSHMTHDTVQHEELLQYRQGFALIRIEVPIGSRLDGVALGEAGLRRSQLQVLAIEEDGAATPVPEPSHVLRAGAHVVLYGAVDAVQDAFGPPATTAGSEG